MLWTLKKNITKKGKLKMLINPYVRGAWENDILKWVIFKAAKISEVTNNNYIS